MRTLKIIAAVVLIGLIIGAVSGFGYAWYRHHNDLEYWGDFAFIAAYVYGLIGGLAGFFCGIVAAAAVFVLKPSRPLLGRANEDARPDVWPPPPKGPYIT